MSDLIPDSAPFVTFYSYKGGVGRSMAVLNVSALLAARGFRVLVIDFDLEAPGLSHLLAEARENQRAKARGGKTKAMPCAGVVELLADAKARGEMADLFAKPFATIAPRYTFAYPIPPELHAHKEGRLFIMPAGQTDESYPARLNDLDLAGLYQQGVGRGLMLHFKKAVAASGLYDYVIIDSRTGHSDEAGICTRDLADHLVVVSGFNRQNLAGTASFLTHLRAAVKDSGTKPKDPTIILSPVPIGEESLLSKREDEAKELFSNAWGRRIPLDLFIPYHPRLALTEDAYVTTRTASYLRDSYQEIEVRLLMAIDHLPAPLLARAKAAINSGNGARAVAILERYAKLQSASPESPSFIRRFPLGWQYDFDLEDDDPLLDKVLALPEAELILRIYAGTKISRSDPFQLGRKLHNRDSPLRAMFDRVILENDLASPDSLGNYAGFLAFIRSDHDAAEAFFKRALEADPKHASNLGYYAIFLKEIRQNHDAAEVFYKRSVDADPKHANNLSNYAIFLTDIRQSHDAAEAFYKRAMEADPKHANNLGNYGQFLIGRGRISEGVSMLREGWRLMTRKEGSNAAELAYALWLGSLIAKREEPAWVRVFKHLLVGGFKRHRWNFDALLVQAKGMLDPATYRYAKALADAFLNEAKVSDLGSFPRWRELQPIRPEFVAPNGEADELPI